MDPMGNRSNLSNFNACLKRAITCCCVHPSLRWVYHGIWLRSQFASIFPHVPSPYVHPFKHLSTRCWRHRCPPRPPHGPHYGSSQSPTNQVVKPPIITNQQGYLVMVLVMKYGYHLMEDHFASDRNLGYCLVHLWYWRGYSKQYQEHPRTKVYETGGSILLEISKNCQFMVLKIWWRHRTAAPLRTSHQ